MERGFDFPGLSAPITGSGQRVQLRLKRSQQQPFSAFKLASIFAIPQETQCDSPKDPAVLKVVRVVNLLRVVFLVRRGDLLSRHTLCGHRFPGNYRHFSSQRRVHGVLNLGGVVKTLRRSNSLFLLSA